VLSYVQRYTSAYAKGSYGLCIMFKNKSHS